MTGKTNKALWLCITIIVFVIAHVVVCHLDCVRITFRYNAAILSQDPVITYRDMSAKFVLVMAAIRIMLLAIPKTGFRVVSMILSVLVALIAASGLAELDIMGITGGLGTSTRALTATGYAAVALSWIIVILQLAMLILSRRTKSVPADRSDIDSASQIMEM